MAEYEIKLKTSGCVSTAHSIHHLVSLGLRWEVFFKKSSGDNTTNQSRTPTICKTSPGLWEENVAIQRWRQHGPYSKELSEGKEKSLAMNQFKEANESGESESESAL